MKNGAAVVEQGQDGMLEMVQQGQEASGRGNPVLGRDREAPHTERDRVSVRQADPPRRLLLPGPTARSPGRVRPRRRRQRKGVPVGATRPTRPPPGGSLPGSDQAMPRGPAHCSACRQFEAIGMTGWIAPYSRA